MWYNSSCLLYLYFYQSDLQTNQSNGSFVNMAQNAPKLQFNGLAPPINWPKKYEDVTYFALFVEWPSLDHSKNLCFIN